MKVKTTRRTEPKPTTIMGYEIEELRLLAELLRKHNLTPEDLRKLTRNVAYAAELLYEEMRVNLENKEVKT